MITSKQRLKPFPITSVCREDILSEKYPKEFVDGIQDWEMKHLANKMADAFLNEDYWIALREYCDKLMEDKGFKKD